MKYMNNKQKGNLGETIAIKYLTNKGYEILEHQYRTYKGEIDIICKYKNYYIFVEVKYRKDLKMGSPLESINYKKISKIKNVANYYIFKNKLTGNFRFDVIGILDKEIQHIENAF